MKKLVVSLLALVLVVACTKDNDVDNEKPTIDNSANTAFPKNCSTVTKGGTLTFDVLFKDNDALGSYNIDIHHNFDHHSHSTDINECNLDPVQTPVNPWTFIQSYSIPDGNSSYHATGEISVPDDIDTGDYHFMYKVTDKSGWQTIMGLSIKVVE